MVPQLMCQKTRTSLCGRRRCSPTWVTGRSISTLDAPRVRVVAKGKGWGFLRNLDELEAFLSDVRASPLPVSVKDQTGVESDEEYERVLDLYCRMPLAELIVHPRVQKDRYTGSPRKEFYGETLERAPFPWPTTVTSLILRTWMSW